MIGRLLGIDYGTKRIGLALTDELRIIASPFETKLNNQEFWNYLSILITKNHITGFVIGKPLHDGENSFVTQVLQFCHTLNQQFALPIFLQDESLSSEESRAFLISSGKRGKKLKKDLDKYAAQTILNNFLLASERGCIEQFIPEDYENYHETI